MSALATMGGLWERLTPLVPSRDEAREALLRVAAFAWLLGFFAVVEAALLKLMY